MTIDDVMKTLKDACEQVGGQAEWARQNGISQQYVNDVIHRRREPGPGILRPIGIEKVETYRRIKP